MSLVAVAAGKDNLTLEDAAVAGVRVMLAQALEGKPFDADAYGSMMSGMARLKATGGGDDVEALNKFFGITDDDEEE